MAQTETAAAVDFQDLRVQFVHSLQKGDKRECSLKVAQAAVNFIRKIVAQEKYENIDELLKVLRGHLRQITREKPSELVVRNIFLIAMKLAREENARVLYGVDKDLGNPYDSLNSLWKKDDKSIDATSAGKKMRKGLISAVREIVTELETSRETIFARVGDVVQINDTMLTYGLNDSPCLRLFIDAARKCTKMRQVLSVSPSLDDTACPDYAASISLRDVAAVMTEVTKVVLPCCAVFPDGACLVPAGALSIAVAAHRHAVPVHVVAAFYKIAPYFAPDAAAAVNTHGSVNLPIKLASRLSNRVILTPLFDIVPAHLLSLYISNTGAVMPAHIYRLITDYYHPEDLTQCDEI